MGAFYVLDDSVVGPDPSGLLKAEFATKLRRIEDRPNILAELSVLDMLSAICRIRDSYYAERLILKGGHSVRVYVPLESHRFSYDLDFNINREAGHTFREVESLTEDLNRFAETRRSKVRASVTFNNQRFHWIKLNYRETIEEGFGARIPEEPKIEICKDCRTLLPPAENAMVTLLDPDLLGVALPHLKQLNLNEQLANKLYVIGVTARQRRQFDIFDCYKIVSYQGKNLDWKIIRDSFRAHLRKENPVRHVDRARRLIASASRDSNTVRRIEAATFEPFDFREAARTISDLYSKLI